MKKLVGIKYEEYKKDLYLVHCQKLCLHKALKHYSMRRIFSMECLGINTCGKEVGETIFHSVVLQVISLRAEGRWGPDKCKEKLSHLFQQGVMVMEVGAPGSAWWTRPHGRGLSHS